MKKHCFFLALALASFTLFGQADRLAISLQMPAKTKGMNAANLHLLESRLKSALRHSDITVLEKGSDILIEVSATPGPAEVVDMGTKKLYSQTLELDLTARSQSGNLEFDQLHLSLRGTGDNGEKAILQAVRGLRPNNGQIAAFVERAKAESIKYFDDNCGQLMERAAQSQRLGELENALGLLASVPPSSSCYGAASEKAVAVYLDLQRRDCEKILAKAKALLATNDYANGMDALTKIDPEAPCFSATEPTFNEVANEVDDNQREAWETYRQLIANAKELEALRWKNIMEWRGKRWRF